MTSSPLALRPAPYTQDEIDAKAAGSRHLELQAGIDALEAADAVQAAQDMSLTDLHRTIADLYHGARDLPFGDYLAALARVETLGEVRRHRMRTIAARRASSARAATVLAVIAGERGDDTPF